MLGSRVIYADPILSQLVCILKMNYDHRPKNLTTALIGTALIWCLAASFPTRAEDAAVPQTPVCAKGEEADGGLCYPKCKDGFKGAGPRCKEICPERTQDHENHCLSGPAQFRKKFYDRAPVAAQPQ
jgi:hypothetical protein